MCIAELPKPLLQAPNQPRGERELGDYRVGCSRLLFCCGGSWSFSQSWGSGHRNVGKPRIRGLGRVGIYEEGWMVLLKVRRDFRPLDLVM